MPQPIQFVPLKPTDVDAEKDPTLGNLNQILQQLVNVVNIQMGAHGPVSFLSDLDMGDKRIKNLGEPKNESDALSTATANPMYSSAAQRSAMEAVGNEMLQTTRRLNDATQRHKVSSDLNTQGSIPPSNITGSLTYTSTTSSVTWTWTNIIIQLADLSYVAVKNGTLAVTGLSAAAYYFYPYFDTQAGRLTFVADSVNAVGVPQVAFSAATDSAAQQQTADGRISLTDGGTVATANGSPGSASLRVRT